MRKNISYIILISSIFIFYNNSHSYNSEITAVYQAVLDKLIKNEEEVVALTESAAKPYRLDAKLSASVLRKIIPGVPMDLANGFIKNLNKTIHLKGIIKDSNKLTWITEQYFKDILSSSNPDREIKKFFDKYPDSRGIYSFSNIGLNRDSTKAILLVSFVCGSACGRGTFFILEKHNDNWDVVFAKNIWGS